MKLKTFIEPPCIFLIIIIINDSGVEGCESVIETQFNFYLFYLNCSCEVECSGQQNILNNFRAYVRTKQFACSSRQELHNDTSYSKNSNACLMYLKLANH